MINWAGVAVAVLSLAYSGFRDFSRNQPLTQPYQTVQYNSQPQQIVYYQLAFDPNTNKWYSYNNGYWYEQPQGNLYGQNQATHPSPVGTSHRTPQPSVGIGQPRQSPQEVANPWCR